MAAPIVGLFVSLDEIFHFLLAFFSGASGSKLSINLLCNFIPSVLRIFAFQSLVSITPKVYQSFLFLIRPFVVHVLFLSVSAVSSPVASTFSALLMIWSVEPLGLLDLLLEVDVGLMDRF